MKRSVKNRLKKLLYAGFGRAQRLGVDILPHHFYSQIPDIADLKSDPYWQPPCSLFGVAGAAIDPQVEFVQSCCPPELTDRLPKLAIYDTAVRENGEDAGYGPIEALFLYCFIYSQRPPKICQIGCGVSTSIVLRAAADAGYTPEVVCIEPYPMPFLKDAHARGAIRLIAEKAQKVALNEMSEIGENGLLFVDSTHTVKPGSEVNRIILEVLPRLPERSWAHFHDIFFPYDYKRDLLDGDLFFWAESSLLHAFLIGNHDFKIQASLSMLHYAAPQALRALFPEYDPQSNLSGLQAPGGRHFPSSIFLRRA